MRSDRTSAWLLRVPWALLPVAAGPALADALDGASTPVRTLSSLGLWTGWALGVLATLVPRPLGLTILRLVAPAAALATVAAAAGGHVSVPGLPLALAVALLSMSAEVTTAFANGGAYPNERRFPLRAPAPLVAGLLPVFWALAVASLTAGPLLLAARQWVPGGAAVAVGAPVAWILLRSLHLMSRRWAVLVPAGLVLHDPMTLADPVLFQRGLIEVLRPAAADSDSLDLTQHAPGLALELVLWEKVPMVLVKPGVREGDAGKSGRLLFTPARPGALLAAAAERRIPVERG